jgi:hypothetical protein
MLKAIAPILKEKDIELVCTGHPFDLYEQKLIDELNIKDYVRMLDLFRSNYLFNFIKGLQLLFFLQNMRDLVFQY